MSTENWSQPISKTFEQVVYFSTSATGYETKKIWPKIVSIISLSIFFFLICEKLYIQISLFE
jgi:hypothetical protein